MGLQTSVFPGRWGALAVGRFWLQRCTTRKGAVLNFYKMGTLKTLKKTPFWLIIIFFKSYFFHCRFQLLSYDCDMEHTKKITFKNPWFWRRPGNSDHHLIAERVGAMLNRAQGIFEWLPALELSCLGSNAPFLWMLFSTMPKTEQN